MPQNQYAITAAILLLALAACGKNRREPSAETFAKGMALYLEKRGDLCVGKSVWPIDVTEGEFRAGARDAVQMPVLEELGLVTSSDAMTAITTEDGTVRHPAKRYKLTGEGRRYFLTRDIPDVGRGGATKGYQKDFCAAKLSLDRIVGWELTKSASGGTQALVTYTYKVRPAPWAERAEAKRVFPAVARVIAGAGTDRLTEGFTLTRDGWVADDLLIAGASASAPETNRQPVVENP